MKISPAILFIYFKFWLFGFVVCVCVCVGGGGVWGGGEGKGQKMTDDYLFQSVCLYLRNYRSYHQDFLVHRCKILIYPGVFLYFLKKYNILNMKILTFFIGLTVFLLNSCFSSSSINAKLACDCRNKSIWTFNQRIVMMKIICVTLLSYVKTCQLCGEEIIMFTLKESISGRRGLLRGNRRGARHNGHFKIHNNNCFSLVVL